MAAAVSQLEVHQTVWRMVVTATSTTAWEVLVPLDRELAVVEEQARLVWTMHHLISHRQWFLGFPIPYLYQVSQESGM